MLKARMWARMCTNRHSMGGHVLCFHWAHLHWGFHGVTTEGLAQLLIQHNFDKGCFIALHLSLYSDGQRFLKLVGCRHLDTVQATCFCDLGILNANVQLRSDEVVRIPERSIAFLSAPLVVAEHHHCHWKPTH